jgi:hypothetical protein
MSGEATNRGIDETAFLVADEPNLPFVRPNVKWAEAFSKDCSSFRQKAFGLFRGPSSEGAPPIVP